MNLRRNLKHFMYKIATNNIFSVLISVAVIVWIFFHGKGEDILDLTLFFALVLSFTLQLAEKMLSAAIKNWTEDERKLDSNYDKLVKRYVDDFIVYENAEAEAKALHKLHKLVKPNYGDKGEKIKTKYRFPVQLVALFHGTDMIIRDSSEMYEIPEALSAVSSELFEAHESSNSYNQLNIRVRDWGLTEQGFAIQTMRTTYFASLITNRAMDYPWSNGLTNRDVYQYGPFIESLAKSKMSNHLGFNGFIKSSDGYIPFVKRNQIVSIGKCTYGDSIGASMKAKYALDSTTKELSKAGMEKAFVQEIKDELKIEPEYLENFNIKTGVIAAYRDFVEGGKPQLLIYAKTTLSKEQIEANFKTKLKGEILQKKRSSWDKELKELEDGSRILWIKTTELKELAIAPGLMVYKNKKLPMMPSASAAVVMLLRWMQERKDERD